MLRLYLSLLWILLFSTGSVGSNAAQTYIFTADPAARGADGHQLYIRDADVAARIPELNRARLDTCMAGMTIPKQLFIEYPPAVTGVHTVRTNRLTCELMEASNAWRCMPFLAQEEVVFGSEPNRHFTLAPGTDLDTAIKIFDAYNEGHVRFSENAKPWIKGLKVREIARDGNAYLIKTADCGCSDGVKVELRREGDADAVVAIASLPGLCS